jgi:hypothetical protein
MTDYIFVDSMNPPSDDFTTPTTIYSIDKSDAQQQLQQDMMDQTNDDPKKWSKKKKIWVIVVCVFVGLAIIATIIAVVLTRPRSSGPKPAPTVTSTVVPPNVVPFILRDITTNNCYSMTNFNSQMAGPDPCSTVSGTWLNNTTNEVVSFGNSVFSTCIRGGQIANSTVFGSSNFTQCQGVTIVGQHIVSEATSEFPQLCINATGTIRWDVCSNATPFLIDTI